MNNFTPGPATPKPDFFYIRPLKRRAFDVRVSYKLTAAEAQTIDDGAAALEMTKTDYVVASARLLLDLHRLAASRAVTLAELLEGL
jgi:acetyl-CoA acetyltransferase